MYKNKILAIINALLGICSLILLIKSGFNIDQLKSFDYTVSNNFLQFALLASVILNTFLSYKFFILKQNKRTNFSVFIFVTCLPLIWLLLLFFGYMMATNILVLLIGSIAIGGLYKILKDHMPKLAIALPTVTFIIFLFAIYSGFEEDYCLYKGSEAEKQNPAMITATKQDAQSLAGWNVKEGQEIGVGFRTHMLCHNTFNFMDAMKDLYL